MSRRSSHTDTSYWLTAPRGIDACINCTEPMCWYDRNDIPKNNECPIWLATPKADDRAHDRAGEALEVIKSVCAIGPISTPDLVAILTDKGYYRNLVYYLIKKDRLDIERIKMHKGSRHKTKIMVKGVKST